jgi:ubiquitin-protein ligase
MSTAAPPPSHPVQKEYKFLIENPIDGIRISLVNDNYMNWRIEVIGPPDTPYEGGSFTADLTFQASYPSMPPKIKFQRPLFHPNFFPDGSPCFSLLWEPLEDPNSGLHGHYRWNSGCTVRILLLSLISRLSEPDGDEAVNEDAAASFRLWKADPDNNPEFRDRVRQEVIASKENAMHEQYTGAIAEQLGLLTTNSSSSNTSSGTPENNLIEMSDSSDYFADKSDGSG